MVRYFCFLLLLLCYKTAFPQSYTNEPLFDLLRHEVKYYYDNLKTDSVPVQFISFGVLDEHTVSIASDMGCASLNESTGRKFCPLISFGEHDKGERLNPFDYSEEDWKDSQLSVADLPLGNDTMAIKNVIWNALGRMYRGSKAVWQKSLKSSTLAAPATREILSANVHYEEPLAELSIDKDEWRKLLNKVTAGLKHKMPMAYCQANLECQDQRRYAVNSEGTAVVCNRRAYTLTLCVTVKDGNGAECPLSKEYFGYEAAEMPNEATLVADMESLALRAQALAKSPVADAYSGPVILSGSAGAVLFHEVLGHRLEHEDAEFQSKKGVQVMPSEFSIYCNPEQKYAEGTPLSGYYLYDDEGHKGQKVECIKDGVMREFLTCRLQGTSNGHGRAAFGKDVQPRQSNLIVETSHPYTEVQLRDMLVAELKRLNKDYGYYISSVSSGWTMSGGGKAIASFNVVPQEAYKVYADGRDDELVRGVSLIGTPLSVFSNIKAGGGKTEVYNGRCGAQSGWIPVACVSPMLYVSQIETQSNHGKHEESVSSVRSGILYSANSEASDPDSVIFQAMEDELSACTESIVDGRRLLFIDYHIRRQAITHITSSMGTCFRYEPEGIKTNGLVHVIVGNRMQSSYNTQNRGKPFNLPDEISYFHIRKNLGTRTETQLRKASLWLERNKWQLADSCRPEWSVLPGRTIIQESALEHWQYDAECLKDIADTLSSVLGTYRELTDSRVEIEQKYSDCYRQTSEGLKIRMPSKKIVISVFADIPLPNGRMMKQRDAYTAYDVSDLPSVDSLITFVERFAQLVIAQSKADCPEEREYVGPVLYQNTAAMLALFDEISFSDNLSSYIHSWFKHSSGEYDDSYRKIGKKVISSNISFSQLGGDSLFCGRRLLRYRRFDADGIRPQTVELVRDGILLNQLAGRIPTPVALTSTGNEYLTEYWDAMGTFPTAFRTGVMRISCRKTMSYGKMLKLLRNMAKRQGLQYAYILKDKGVLTRVETRTGKEELLRLRCFDNPSKVEMMGDLIASKEVTANVDISVIHPQFILLPIADLTFKSIDTSHACERFMKLKH